MSKLEIFTWASGIVVFIISLYYTIRHFKIVRSISFIERLNNPSMIRVREIVDSWADSEKSDKKKIKQLENDKELRVNVRILYSIFTEIGIAYRRRIVSRNIIRDTYNPIVPEYWNKLEFYILYMRKNGVKIGYSFIELNNVILKYQDRNWGKRAGKFDEAIIEKRRILKDRKVQDRMSV